MSKVRRGRTKFKVVKIDETSQYNDKEFVKRCGKIYGVYMYDGNRRSCLCSPITNYYVTLLYSVAENELSEEDRQRLDDADTEPCQDSYMPCSYIDGVKSKSRKVIAPDKLNGSYSLEESVANDEYRELYDDAWECLKGNWLLS
jgi:hypothetical protein